MIMISPNSFHNYYNIHVKVSASISLCVLFATTDNEACQRCWHVSSVIIFILAVILYYAESNVDNLSRCLILWL